MVMKKLISLVLVLALTLSLCAAATADTEKVFRTYLGSDTPILNGHNSVETSLDTPIGYCGATLYRTVVDETRLNYKYIGDIAADLPEEVSENVWQIKLRPEACWANGEPINADTVMYSFKMLLDPNLSNQMADFLSDYNITIVNAKEYSKQTSDAPVAWEDVGIKKVDDYTIEITTTSTVTAQNVCSQFTNRATAMVYEPYYEAGMNEDRTATTYGLTAEQWMSAGPYKLDTWVHDSVQTTMAATFILSILLSILGVVLVRPLLVLMNTPDDVFRDAALYLRIYIGGISGLLIYNMGSGILRAVGDSTRPLYFLILTSLLNIVLDLFFVLVLKAGIAGAAIATILSQFVSAVLTLVLLTRTQDIYRLNWKGLRIDGPILRKIFSIGMPTGLQAIITSISNIFVQGYINVFGSGVMAGWSSYNKLDQFILLPMQSMAMASTTFVSQNTGAGNEQRSDRGTAAALVLASAITAGIAALLYVYAPAAVRLFSPDAEVIEYGALFLHTNVFFLVFNCVNHVLAGALRGRGDSKGPMIIMLSTFVGLRQIYLFLVTRFVANTPRIVGFGYPAGWVSCCVIELLYYRIRKKYRPAEQLLSRAE